jgi:hypothetical protein
VSPLVPQLATTTLVTVASATMPPARTAMDGDGARMRAADASGEPHRRKRHLTAVANPVGAIGSIHLDRIDPMNHRIGLSHGAGGTVTLWWAPERGREG